MRTFCKVFLIVLLIAVTARAADSRQPIISEHVFTDQVPDSLNHPSAKSDDAVVNGTTFPSAKVPRKFPSGTIEMRPYCLTMRTMKFAQRAQIACVSAA